MDLVAPSFIISPLPPCLISVLGAVWNTSQCQFSSQCCSLFWLFIWAVETVWESPFSRSLSSLSLSFFPLAKLHAEVWLSYGFLHFKRSFFSIVRTSDISGLSRVAAHTPLKILSHSLMFHTCMFLFWVEGWKKMHMISVCFLKQTFAENKINLIFRLRLLKS